jgi:hypothetical protein
MTATCATPAIRAKHHQRQQWPDSVEKLDVVGEVVLGYWGQ